MSAQLCYEYDLCVMCEIDLEKQMRKKIIITYNSRNAQQKTEHHIQFFTLEPQNSISILSNC